MTRRLSCLLFAVLALAWPLGVVAQPVEVDVELVFLSDASNSIDNPFEYPHVFAKPRPHKLAILIPPEPIYPENSRRIG